MLKDLEQLIATTQDFPQKGILFRDIAPLLAQKFPETIDALSSLFTTDELNTVDAFAGIDARGFVFASAMAAKHGKNMVMIRKGGKLPPPSLQQSYALEYGTATLEMKPTTGGKLILLDDVLATGGTMKAAADLCDKAGYTLTCIAALINLKDLNAFSWNNIKPRCLFTY